ncbi:nitroreductase family protein, partial [Stenotrophomonas maltophilia]
PHTEAQAWVAGPQEGRPEAALRNGSLQGAYRILAARALGLEAGPMSGFDPAKVDEAFFAGTSIKSNILVNR